MGGGAGVDLQVLGRWCLHKRFLKLPLMHCLTPARPKLSFPSTLANRFLHQSSHPENDFPPECSALFVTIHPLAELARPGEADRRETRFKPWGSTGSHILNRQV
jgi:hypothetical protein